MKYLLCFLVALATPVVGAQTMNLDGSAAADSASRGENEYLSDIFGTEVVTNVSVPTLTAFLPEQGNGMGVVIAPGGGFHALSINSEGNDVARWLNERGVAAFVLRYRLVAGGDDVVAGMLAKPQEQSAKDMAQVAPLAGADGLAAMRLVKSRAAEFGVDPEQVGFMGFSAGGAVTLHVAHQYDAESKPAFVAPIYAAARWLDELALPADAPPVFIVAAMVKQPRDRKPGL